MLRKNQGLLEDLVDIVSGFPWWVGRSLAPQGLEIHLPSSFNIKQQIT